MDTVLGVNIGTLSTEACMVDVASGKVVSQCSVVHSPGIVNPAGLPLGAEMRSQVWTDAALRAMNEMVVAAERMGAIIGAVAVSSMLGGLNVPVDRGFTPLLQVPIWLDGRAVRESRAAMEAIDGEHLRNVTLNVNASPSLGFTKLIWYMASETERFKRTRALVTPNGMVVHLLTGQHVTDICSLGAFGGVLDMRGRRVDLDLLFRISEVGSGLAGQRLDLSPDLFGRLVACDEVVGPVTAGGAGLSLLPEGIPVVASGLDAPIALIASGGRVAGDNVLMMGTSWTLGVLGEMDGHEPVAGLIHMPHVLDGDRMLFTMTGGPYTGGSAGFWMPEMVTGSSFAKLEREARLVPPGAGGVTFLPYLMGDRTPLGGSDVSGAFLGLRADHGRAHMFRAVLEGGVLLHEECLEQVERTGVALRTTRVVDGAYRSSTWRAMLADITGRPVLYQPDFPGVSYGDAMLAACASGLSTRDDVFAWLPGPRTIEPTSDPGRVEAYAAARERYRHLRDTLRGPRSLNSPER